MKSQSWPNRLSALKSKKQNQLPKHAVTVAPKAELPTDATVNVQTVAVNVVAATAVVVAVAVPTHVLKAVPMVVLNVAQNVAQKAVRKPAQKVVAQKPGRICAMTTVLKASRAVAQNAVNAILKPAPMQAVRNARSVRPVSSAPKHHATKTANQEKPASHVNRANLVQMAPAQSSAHAVNVQIARNVVNAFRAMP